jgi:hypothetical protein
MASLTLPDGVVKIWEPQAGSQVLFLTCPIFECLYEGTRGPGKTDALLMDFLREVGTGLGPDWRGILFRRTYKELGDVVAKTQKWFPQIFPGASFNKQEFTWSFPDGEQLLLRHGKTVDDYWSYHGHAYPWIGWEELTNWADDGLYRKMFSCCRSTNPRVPKRVRATCNPYGSGHNWVKRRFRLPYQRGIVIRDAVDQDGNPEPMRVALHGSIRENRILLDADPEYIARLRASARNKAELAAWLYGRWDIVAGGMFDDVFEMPRHAIEPFNVPRGWRVDRSFDWGSSKPFSVGWWAQSDGSDAVLADGRKIRTVRGDLFRIHEWYGCSPRESNVGLNMLAAEIAKGIKDREAAMLQRGLIQLKPRAGPADSAIWTEENGPSIASDMAKAGVMWEKADKSPGSRKHGWEQMRKRFLAAIPPWERPNVEPGTVLPHAWVRDESSLFIFRTCKAFLDTVPTLPRDDKDTDDVDTDAEDHVADEARYRCRATVGGVRQGAM